MACSRRTRPKTNDGPRSSARSSAARVRQSRQQTWFASKRLLEKLNTAGLPPLLQTRTVRLRREAPARPVGDYCRCVTRRVSMARMLIQTPKTQGIFTRVSIELRQVERPLPQLLVTAVECSPGGLAEPEVRLQHFHRMLDGDGEMPAHLVRRAIGIATAYRLGQFLMASWRIIRLRPSHHAEPDRRQCVRLFDRVEQRRASSALRDAGVKFLMHRLIERAVQLHRQLIDANGQLFQLGTFPGCGNARESHCRLHLEGFTHDVVSLDIFG